MGLYRCFGHEEKKVELPFILRIIFHRKYLTENNSLLVSSLFEEFSEVVDLYIHDYFEQKVEYRVEFKNQECECQKSAFGWNLIMFFSDRWQDVKSVEIEYDGKKINIFPLDVGTCS